LLDWQYCYPLTVTDGCTRFILGCQGLRSTAHVGAKPVLHRLFQQYGLYVSLPVDSIDDGSKMLRRDRRLIEVATFASNDCSVRRVEQFKFLIQTRNILPIYRICHRCLLSSSCLASQGSC